jgi:hypothetical protein
MTLDAQKLRALAEAAPERISQALGHGEPTASETFYKAARESVIAMLDLAAENGKWIDHAANVEIDLRKQLAAAQAEVERLRPAYEIARRWCNRPESVLREGASVLANDAEMWRKLRAAVAAEAVVHNCQSPTDISDESKSAIEDIVAAALRKVGGTP